MQHRDGKLLRGSRILMSSQCKVPGSATAPERPDACAPNALVGEDGLMSDSDTAELTPDGI